AARKAILRNELIVRDGFHGFGLAGLGLGLRNDVLAHFILAQLHPIAPDAGRCRRASFNEGHILSSHGMLLQLLDKMLPRRWIERHTENTARILVEAMDGQRLEPPPGCG